MTRVCSRRRLWRSSRMIGRRSCILSWMYRRRTSLLVCASSLRHLVFVLGNCDYMYCVVPVVLGMMMM
jgi:hypothetical protein